MKSWLKPGRLALIKSGRGSEAGYTITESLIVLAVTAVMFAAVVAAFSGRQARVEFTKSVRDYESFLEGIISEVESSHYDVLGGCTVPNKQNPEAYPQIDPTAPAVTGSNKDCIFLGKLMVIGDRTVIPPGTEEDITSVATLIGRRTVPTVGGERLISSIPESRPILSTDFVTDPVDDDPWNSRAESAYRHSFGLRITTIKSLYDEPRVYNRPPADGEIAIPNIGISSNAVLLGFGFIFGVSGTSNGDGLVKLYTYPEEVFERVKSEGATPKIYDGIYESKGIKVCLKGQNGQNAELDIGENNGQVNIVSTLDTPDPQPGELCHV